ncbi:hypothetical protein IWQ60_009106 [Tieghemiomyces parasiticus]|uniref:Mating factor alpha n=1 Tax=Tieghemiomyces parasiticus TaxID=78921 RepID=A0A9W7ZV72_9FUNG|nr:hypothetical protein IWQ60_009106 [Tieghemiomyces parasiticus]
MQFSLSTLLAVAVAVTGTLGATISQADVTDYDRFHAVVHQGEAIIDPALEGLTAAVSAHRLADPKDAGIIKSGRDAYVKVRVPGVAVYATVQASRDENDQAIALSPNAYDALLSGEMAESSLQWHFISKEEYDQAHF